MMSNLELIVITLVVWALWLLTVAIYRKGRGRTVVIECPHDYGTDKCEEMEKFYEKKFKCKVIILPINMKHVSPE
jgi:hypothetical protein